MDASADAAPLSPTGHRIVGTLETLRGVAHAALRREGDRLIYDYNGQKEIWWDRIRTVTFRGKPLFADEAEQVWTEEEILSGRPLHEEHDAVRESVSEIIDACTQALALSDRHAPDPALVTEIERARNAASRLLMEYEGM